MKMVMLIAVIGITVGIQRIGSTGNDQMQAKGIVRLLAVLAVLLWLGIVACGRWIAYT
jgi:uncharacterized membrane protein YciS (DUF1049 family)